MTRSLEAAKTHGEAFVLIAHLHLQRKFAPQGIEYHLPAEDLPGRQVDIPKLRRGGVKCIWLSEGGPGEFFVDPEAGKRGTVEPNHRPAIRTVYHGSSQVQRMLRGFDAVCRLCRDHAEHLELATSVRQAREIAARGKIAVFWHSESLLIANDLAALRCYHAMGMRMAALVHGSPLEWVDCDLEQHEPGGLTDFGRQVVREMNAMGMVIDVSHSSEQTIRDVLEETRHPVVASHSNAKRLSPIMRNLSDDLIQGIAKAGGVIGIHCSSAFVDIACLHGRRTDPPSHNQLRLDMIGKILAGAVDPFCFEADLRSTGTRTKGFYPTVRLEQLIDHVDHMVNLVGIDHVGVGTDFQFLEDAVEDFDSVDKVPNLTQALLTRGYFPGDVQKILGGNFLRVMEAVIGE
jgi:membrane dipeptidase